jgi:hypothetical protein
MDIGFDSDIASRIGSFLVSFEDVLTEMKKKTGGMNFRDWSKERFNI